MIAAHPRIAIPEESQFIPIMFAAYGEPASQAETRRLVDAILSLRWIRDWGCEFDRRRLYDCTSFATVVAGLFESYAAHERKPRWGDKTPQYVACVPLLAALFPDARFLHIHRDPRDVVPSWVAAPFGPSNCYVAASEWSRLVTTGRDSGTRLEAGRYLEVSYEELVRHPHVVLPAICGFLGETFSPAMLRPKPYSGRMPEYRLWRPPGRKSTQRLADDRVEPSRAAAWRTGLSPHVRAIIESAAQPGMAAFGYDREGHVRPVGRLERILWTVHDRLCGAMMKINTVPTESLPAMARELFAARWRARRARPPGR